MFSEMTIAELKEELRERGLPVSGSKAELTMRLLEHDDANEAEVDEGPEADDDYSGWYDRILEAMLDLTQAIRDLTDAAPRVRDSLPDGDDAEESHLAPVSDSTQLRDDIRGAARRLLTAQPDGRKRALRVLGEYGGSVSAVPENDLERCLTSLENEIAEMDV